MQFDVVNKIFKMYFTYQNLFLTSIIMDIQTIKRYRSERNWLLGNSQEKIVFEISHTEDEDDFFTRLLKIESGTAF